MERYLFPRFLFPVLLLFPCQQALATDTPWASAEPRIMDIDAWPVVAILLRLRDVDSYGGDSHSYYTSFPNPRNPYACLVGQPRGDLGCWQISLSSDGRALPVLQQRTFLDPHDLRQQQLWLVYRAEQDMAPTDPLEIELVMDWYGSERQVLKADSRRLELTRTARQPLLDPPWEYVMAGAEVRLKHYHARLPQRTREAGLPSHWERFVGFDCAFREATLQEDARSCRYEHIHALLEAEQHAAPEGFR